MLGERICQNVDKKRESRENKRERERIKIVVIRTFVKSDETSLNRIQLTV